MAGPVSMAPQGKTPHVPSAAPMFDAQMDIGKAVQGVGKAISAEIDIADKAAEKETKEQEAIDVNNADVEYRSAADEISRTTRESKDGYDNWTSSFREGVDKTAGEILDRYPNLTPKTRDRLLAKWDSHDRVYVNRLESEAGKVREDTRFGQTRDNLLRSLGPALDPNSDMTPEQVDDLMRQSLGNLALAREYLPPKRVDALEKEVIQGSGPNSIIYQYGLREGAREVEKGQGIGTGQMLKDIDDALPHAGSRYGGSSRAMQSLDPLTRLQDKGSLSAPASTYNGPMPRIEKAPDGQPFNPEAVPTDVNKARPNFERGRMQLGVKPDAEPIEIPYFTGSKDKPNYPGLQYGAFTLLPHRVGESHRYGDTISINPLGAERQSPIADPKVGRSRNGQLIHPEQGNPTNIGCISIPDDKWPEVKSAVAQMWKQHGKTNVVLVNAPGVTQVMSRQQYDAMYGKGGVDAGDGEAPAQVAGGDKRFLVLPGLKGTYGSDRAAFDEIANKYGGKADYLDGDPGWGGVGKDGATSPQVKAAVEKLATGEYDGIIGFSAGGYNVRQILQSPEFKALPEEKRARIQKVVAVGISDQHLKDFKLDERFKPEVYGNIGGAHLDAPRALAKQLGISTRQASAEGLDARVSPQEFFRGKGVNVDQLPLGMRISNNPGNLKYSGSAWQKSNLYGLVGPSTAKDQGDPQAQFANPLAGMASAVKLAQTKFNAHGLNTVEKIITDTKQGWTPGFKGAADAIARQMGVKPTDKIDLNDQGTMRKFMRALITQEHGESGKLYDDKLISRGVDIAFGNKGETSTRTADAGAPPGRMNLGGPKDDKITSEPLDPVEEPDTGARDALADPEAVGSYEGGAGFVAGENTTLADVEAARSELEASNGGTPASAKPADRPAAKAVDPGTAGPAMPGGEPSENVSMGAGDITSPMQAERRDYNGLSARARVLSHLSPESLLKLRTRTQTILSDSGKVFQDTAVAHAARTGEDWRHPATGQTYAEWARGTRQPQQVARGERLIEAAKQRFAATADIAFLNEAEFRDRLNKIESEADPSKLADTYKLTDKLMKDRNKVEEIKRLNAAQSVSGFSINRGDRLPVYEVDPQSGRVIEMKDPEGYAKPHPYVRRALDDIKEMGELGATIVETPEGLSINTSKVITPAAKPQLWGRLFTSRLAAQEQIGIPEDSRKMITQYEAQKFLGTVPKEAGEFETHWKKTATRIEAMVGPENAPRVLREMRDFYVKDQGQRDVASGDIQDRVRGMFRAPGANWASTGAMENVPYGGRFSMSAARSLERADRLGRAFEAAPGPDMDSPSIGQATAPSFGFGNTMDIPKNLMPEGARGPARAAAEVAPPDDVKKWVLERASDPDARKAIDLRYGRNAFARIIDEAQNPKKKR